MGAKTAVLGASGYSGGELLRLLAGHPDMTLSETGAALGEPADIVFSCLPSGELRSHLGSTDALVVDLSDDNRADPAWTYGLTEFNRRRLTSGAPIANPG